MNRKLSLKNSKMSDVCISLSGKTKRSYFGNLKTKVMKENKHKVGTVREGQGQKYLFHHSQGKAGADPEILKNGRQALHQPPWLTGEKNFRVQMTLETISFCHIFITIFLNFLHFYRKNLTKFSKFTNALIRKEKKLS